MIKRYLEELDEKNKIKISTGGIYVLYKDIEVNKDSPWRETLCKGTPLKVLSIDETKGLAECVDYRGVRHFIELDILNCTKEIKKYPNPFERLYQKTNNFLAVYGYVSAKFFLFIAVMIAIMSSLIEKASPAWFAVYLVLMLISVIIVITCVRNCWVYRPLYEKVNLYELKMLIKKDIEKDESDKGEKIDDA